MTLAHKAAIAGGVSMNIDYVMRDLAEELSNVERLVLQAAYMALRAKSDDWWNQDAANKNSN